MKGHNWGRKNVSDRRGQQDDRKCLQGTLKVKFLKIWSGCIDLTNEYLFDNIINNTVCGEIVRNVLLFVGIRGFWTSSTPVWRTLWPWGNTTRKPWQVSEMHTFDCVVLFGWSNITESKMYSSSGVTVAAKGYFDALVKLGELASDSQGSKELGEWAAGWRRAGVWGEN